MFYVKGKCCNTEFHCINKAREFRKQMRQNNQDAYITMTYSNGDEVIFKTNNFVVIGLTTDTFRVFNTFEDANAYRNQLIAVSNPYIYVNLGKITQSDIDWYLL